jgi:hypothetical protein
MSFFRFLGCIDNMSDSLVEHLENWSEQDLPAASQTEQQVTTFDWNTLMF